MANNNTLDYYKNQLAKAKSDYADAMTAAQQANSKGDMTTALQQRSKVDKAQKLIDELSVKINSMGGDANAVSTEDYSILSDITSSISSGVSEILSPVTESLMSTASLGMKSISDLASKANDSIKSIFSADAAKLKENAALASAKEDTGQKETDSKIKSIASSDNTAIVKPTAFKAGGGNGIGATTNVPQDAGETEVPKTGQLAKTAQELKEKDNTDGSWLSTLKSSSKDLQENIAAASKSVNETVTTAKAAVGDAINSAVGEVKEMTKVFSTAVQPVTGAITEVISCGSGIANSIADALPESVGKYVRAGYASALQSASNKILGSKAATVASLAGLLPGVTDTSNLWSIVSGLSTGTADTLLDENGNVISGTGGNTASDINALFAAAGKVCSGVSSPNATSQNQQQSLYDSLMALAGQKGASGLLSQMAACTGSSGNQSLFTSSTISILQSCLDASSSKGDVETTSAIVEAIGGQNVSAPKELVTTLVGNMDTESAKKIVNASTTGNTSSSPLHSIMNECNVTVESLTSTPTPVGSALDATSIAIMSSNNNAIIDSMIGTDTRSLTQAALIAYS